MMVYTIDGLVVCASARKLCGVLSGNRPLADEIVLIIPDRLPDPYMQRRQHVGDASEAVR